jgi:PIN domain nuclease of toxin-antitoxin system
MRLLLDTHTFLWWLEDNPLLATTARAAIEIGENEVFFSAASAWEIAVKTQLGKLRLPSDPEPFISQQLQLNGFRPMPIGITHALHTASLETIHRDPFDRILIAQSQLEQMPLVTADPLITQYNVSVLW